MKKYAILTALVAFFSASANACYNQNNRSYCTGDIVISDNGDRGKIAGVFRNGDVTVKFDSSFSFNKWPVERLALTRGCAKRRKYCVGDVVISDNGSRAKIAGIFLNGDVSVNFDNSFGYYKWPINRLARTKGCARRSPFCIGTKIISDNGSAGVVEGIHRDGTISVKFDHSFSYVDWPQSRLAIRRGCTSDDYCVTDVIFSDNGNAGVVAGILSSGNVMVRFNSSFSFNEWPTSRLAVTDACTDRSVLDFK